MESQMGTGTTEDFVCLLYRLFCAAGIWDDCRLGTGFVRLLSNISFGGVFYGGLPGTSSIILGQMSPTTSLNFAIVVNQEVETPNSPFASDLEQKVQKYLTGVTKWPTIDLF